MKLDSRIQKTVTTALCILVLSPALVFAGKAKAAEERGVIKSVDMDAHTLIVTEHHKKIDQTFTWNDQTKFKEHAKNTSASALKAGEHLRFTYAPGDAFPVLESVHITPAKAQKTSANNRSTAGNIEVKS